MSEAASPVVRRSPSVAGAVALFLIVCAVGVAADLFTKWLAFDHEPTRLIESVVHTGTRWQVLGDDARAVVVIPRLLDLHATVNEGAVFGIGQGRRGWFLVVSLAAIAFLCSLAARTRSRFEVVLLGCLLAGVLGNMYDRVKYGYVRDMILALPGVHWPGAWQMPLTGYPGGGERLVFPYIFNVADCLLVCGVIVLLVRSFFVSESEGKGNRRGAESAEESQRRAS